MGKKQNPSKNSRVAYLYLGIASVIILILFAILWYGSPDDRLLKAINRCDVNTARQELERRANVNVRASADDLLPGAPGLVVAVNSGCVEIVTLLLNQNADVNAKVTGRARTGWTALMVAVDKEQIELVRLLLQHGADVTLTIAEGEKQGWNALKIAEAKNNPELVNLLKTPGAM